MKVEVRHETVGPARARHRLRIAHLSDLHLLFSDRTLRALEPILVAWQPDALALTGDYADTPVGRRLALGWIAKMAAIYPLCWIAGNHDHWFGRRFLTRLQSLPAAHAIDRRDAWIRAKDGGHFRVTTPERLSSPAREASPGPAIVLMHDPADVEQREFNPAENHLLLAGHLHGGQITLWRDRQGRPQPAASRYRWLVDRADLGASTLIVSRGLGEMLPLRIGAPREVVMIDLAS